MIVMWSGLYTPARVLTVSLVQHRAEGKPCVQEQSKGDEMALDLDDEELDMFGASSSPAKLQGDAGESRNTGAAIEDASVPTHVPRVEASPTRHFCVVSRPGGQLELYLIVEGEEATRLELVFECEEVPRTLSNLYDTRTPADAFADLPASPLPSSPGDRKSSILTRTLSGTVTTDIVELQMSIVDEDLTRPMLVCVFETGAVVLHRAYSFESNATGQGGAFGFTRIEHDHQFGPTKDQYQAQEETAETESSMRTPRIVPFSSVGGTEDGDGYSGFFICGARPAWVISEREAVRVHPMMTDGQVKSFTSLNTVNCGQGFVTLNHRSQLKVCRLPTEVQFGGPWPCRKIALKATPHKIVFHEQTQTYAVITSTLVQADKPAPVEVVDENGIIVSNEAVEDDGPKAKRLARVAEQFELRILSPQLEWDTVDTYGFQPDEHVLAITAVKLTCATRVTQKDAAVHNMVAIGTAQCEGEDKTCKGRIILLDIESTLSGPRIVEGYVKEEKGPITALAQLHSCYVIATAGTAIDPTHRGTTIIVHKFKVDEQDNGKGKLSPAAFYHCQIYVSTLCTLPRSSIILYGDAFKSVPPSSQAHCAGKFLCTWVRLCIDM